MEKNRAYIPKSIWYSIIASYVCGIAITFGALVYMKHVDTESNRKWCEIVVTTDDTYVQTPPTTDAGKKFAIAIHKLRNDFEC